ncbi:MAG: Rpn family recombination-promoting nuclease/putative transposase [Gammaproteobacteria bacterium]|nr:Rpn family recombination-promoting nuclease/putative transposase [Gammaproteobacteria bacterium]
MNNVIKTAAMEAAAEAREEGKKEGIEIGKQEGIEQGIEIGKQEGIERGIEIGKHAEKLEIARNMLNKGLEVALIAQLTGLTPDDIKALR